jgi:hypothetical protein
MSRHTTAVSVLHRRIVQSLSHWLIRIVQFWSITFMFLPPWEFCDGQTIMAVDFTQDVKSSLVTEAHAIEAVTVMWERMSAVKSKHHSKPFSCTFWSKCNLYTLSFRHLHTISWTAEWGVFSSRLSRWKHFSRLHLKASWMASTYSGAVHGLSPAAFTSTSNDVANAVVHQRLCVYLVDHSHTSDETSAIHLYLRTYLLMKLSPLEETLIGQPVKNFPAFHETQRFNTVFTSTLHWYLSWAISIQSTTSHRISQRSIFILSIHPWLGLLSGPFPSGFPTKIPYAFLFSPHSCYMPCPCHTVIRNLNSASQ